MTIPESKTYAQLPVETYQSQLDEKKVRLTELLTPFTDSQILDKLSVYQSPTSHFRMRTEFGVWHEGDDCFYTMSETDENDIDGGKKRVKVTQFATANQAINKLMPELLAKVKANPLLKNRLFQVEFLSTLAGNAPSNMLVTMIYHRKLDEEWQQLAQELQVELNCLIIGRSRKQKVVLTQDYVVEELTVLGKNYRYKQLEGGFTQPNAAVCQHMLTWACQQATLIHQDKPADDDAQDLLELYCGNANFTLPLSQYFRKVLATEISKTSVYAAEWNIAENIAHGTDKIAIARLSAEEFTEAKNATREFRRLTQAGIELASYDFSTVFVDPPRAGIDDDTLKLLSEFENIIYISCNPETLADNLQMLCKTHEVMSSALFDQFPYTHHIEAGVFLKKKA